VALQRLSSFGPFLVLTAAACRPATGPLRK
jgi:hypothetical protein